MQNITKHKILKLSLLFGLSIASLVFIDYHWQIINWSLRGQTALTQDFAKQQAWDTMKAEVDSWTDGLGLGIDPLMKDTVTVLNLLGFKTDASCQGHIDHGLPYPWIDFFIMDNDIERLYNKELVILREIEQKRSQLVDQDKKALHQLDADYATLHTISDSIEKAVKTKLISFQKILNDFYKNRSNPDTMIVIHQINPTFMRLYSLGGNWQVTRNDDEKAKKLIEYQKEMNRFTDFLIKYYFAL